MYRSAIGDKPRLTTANSNEAVDIHMIQFIVDLNPVNKLIRESLTKQHLRRLEKESWARFKILAAVRHAVDKLLEDLIPPTQLSHVRGQAWMVKMTIVHKFESTLLEVS